jgi:hypothetical protein
MGQGFILYRFKFAWMDEIVLKHGNLAGLKASTGQSIINRRSGCCRYPR